MKKTLLLSVALFWASIGFSQTTETRSLGSFTVVSAQEGIDVILRPGAKSEAIVTSENIDLEEVLTEISGQTLKIHLEGNSYRNVDVKVTVTYQSLTGVRSSSGASLTVEGLVKGGSQFEVDASSGSSLSIELEAGDVNVDISSSGEVQMAVKAQSLDADLSSSGELTISGSVDRLDVETSSAGEFDGYDLTCKEASLDSSSGSTIRVTVTERLEAEASSGSSVRYRGDPSKTNVSSSSGGSIRKG